MKEVNNIREPVLQLHINGSAVVVMFGKKEGMDVKARVREILTEAYKERFQKEQNCGTL